MLFLAGWARKRYCKEIAEALHICWDQVCDGAEYVGRPGPAASQLESIPALGVDDIQYARSHKHPWSVEQTSKRFWSMRYLTC